MRVVSPVFALLSTFYFLLFTWSYNHSYGLSSRSPARSERPRPLQSWSNRSPGQRIRCYACGHECPIPDGAVGVCKVRLNRGGHLRVPWGYVGGIQCDPIEKKPFFHARPGALAFSFGMLGCDLHCSYCQNWVTSQALRDPHAIAPPIDASPTALVDEAKRLGAPARGQHLQRAADHQRMGRRDFQGSARRRA